MIERITYSGTGQSGEECLRKWRSLDLRQMRIRLLADMEAIPYAIVNEDSEKYRESVYRARAIVRERLRLAMGLLPCVRKISRFI